MIFIDILYKNHTNNTMGCDIKYIRVKNVGVSPEHLNNDLEEEIKKKVTSLLLNTQTKFGLVLSIDNIKIVDEGQIRFDNTGYSRYNIIVKIKIYLPILGEKISTKIKDIMTNGFYVDEPIEIFISSETKIKKNINDVVDIKITKVTFNKGKFIVLAKEI